MTGTGSSPLTRGKRFGEDLGGFGGGIIPAHAGKTLRDQGRGDGDWDHPRSRGENLVGFGGGLVGVGSSPLTRGKRVFGEGLVEQGGIIPAHAGKTAALHSRVQGIGDHPRSRGENVGAARTQRGDSGSSPLTRGKHNRPGCFDELLGIIPAHAGKTFQVRDRHCTLRDHPRSRGENILVPSSNVNGKGSSPLTRGKRSSRAN